MIYNKQLNQENLGTLLSNSERTTRIEIKRGLVEHLKNDLSTHFVYIVEIAQNNADFNSSAKGLVNASKSISNRKDTINNRKENKG